MVSFHRVVAASGEGMTAQQTPCRQQCPAAYTILADRLNGVLGTGGDKSTDRREKWRDNDLISFKNGYQTGPGNGVP